MLRFLAPSGALGFRRFERTPRREFATGTWLPRASPV